MKRTAFYQYHTDHGARFVDFAGWEMPILYDSIRAEHEHVRHEAGLFDVSHMGRIRIKGRGARKFVERIVTRRVTDMKSMTCRYSVICNESGGVLDDVLVYRFNDYWMIVVNASNRQKIVDHMQANVGDLSVQIEDATEQTAMIALQGPKVMEFIGRFSKEVPTLKRFSFCRKNLLILEMIISRTGYTGEDGVEVIMPSNMATMALKLLAKESPDEPVQVKPCGLGARDTLRMEAAMPLYGHELDEQTDPLSAGLKFAVSLDKDEQELGEPFIGQEALKRIAAEGPSKKLIGLKLDGKRTARQGMDVQDDGKTIGSVTSGCLSPTLGYPIAMAYVAPDHAEVGKAMTVIISDKPVEAEVVKLPFYKAT